MATKETITKTNDVLNNLFDIKDKLTDKEYKDLMDSVMILPRFVKIKYLRVEQTGGVMTGEGVRECDLDSKMVIGNYQVVKSDEDCACCLAGLLGNGKVSQHAVDMYFNDEGNIHPLDTCCNVVCIIQMWKI